MAELRKDSLSFAEALGQSVANASPTFTPALGVGVVIGMAGVSAWFVYGVATLALLVVSTTVATLAKRIPCAGSFFIYVSRSLGPLWGMMTGWAMVWSYLVNSIAMTVATSILIKALLVSLGSAAVPSTTLIYIAISVLLWIFAYHDIRLSSRMGLVLEALSMTIIIVVCVATWSRLGFQADTRQLKLQGATFSGTTEAVLFVLYSYAGFESAATLGQETRNPHVVIPRAIVLTPVIGGVFMMFTTYVICLGFGDNVSNLTSSAAPLSDLASHLSKWLAVAVYFGAMISIFASALASLNGSARMLYSMGRYRFIHQSMGLVHSRHKTPHWAVTVGVIISLIVLLAMPRVGEIELLGYLGLTASFGYIVIYIASSIASPVYLSLIKEPSKRALLLGVIGATVMSLALVGSVYPIPPYPYNCFIYLFLMYMVVGAGWFVALKKRTPKALQNLEKDLETDVESGIESGLIADAG
jgi:amino acid transporter